MKKHLQIPLILILVSLSPVVFSQQWADGLPEDTPFPNINALISRVSPGQTRHLLARKNSYSFLYDPAIGDPFARNNSWSCLRIKQYLIPWVLPSRR